MPNFSRETLPELHLERAPLAKVLMQVQFSRTPNAVTEEAEATLADRLGRYPVRRRQAAAQGAFSVIVNGQPLPGLAPSPTASTFLTFADAASTWIVSVTDTAVSLETTVYESRSDFCERSLELFAALAAVALPPVVDRVGLRYVNRLTGGDLDQLSDFVIPQLRGLHGCMDGDYTLVHSVTDSQIEISADERLQVRSGYLPAAAAFDAALPASPEPSWVLDLDVFTTSGGFAFDPEALTQRLRTYAETAYVFFRFATTDALQEHSGAVVTHPVERA